MRVLFWIALSVTLGWLYAAYIVSYNSSTGFREFRAAFSSRQQNVVATTQVEVKSKIPVNKTAATKQPEPDIPKKPDGLHEWGDFLAGTFAPISFMWVVLAFMSQAKQLKLTTRALTDQQIEQIRAAKISAMTALISHEWSQNAVFNQIQETYHRSGDMTKSTEYRELAISSGKRARVHAAELRKILNIAEPE